MKLTETLHITKHGAFQFTMIQQLIAYGMPFESSMRKFDNSHV
jgi:hypothetical protein